MDRQKFREYVSTKGLKFTKERDEILNEILNTKGHFDPEELFVKLKSKGSKISRASIYRTIPLLEECGFIEKVERIDRHSHYEKVSTDSHHDHMICVTCGKVIEFYSPTLEMLQDEICGREKFRGIRHTLEIFGHCKRCQ